MPSSQEPSATPTPPRRSFLRIDQVDPADKAKWVRAAIASGKKLDVWVQEQLNAASADEKRHTAPRE